jgi:hypothetical protein
MTMLENPYYHDEEAKQQRSYIRRVILWLLVAVVIGWALYAGKAQAQMHERIAMIVVVFSPDGERYQDFVGTFADEKSCQAARVGVLKNALQHYGKESYVYSICTKARSLSAVEV